MEKKYKLTKEVTPRVGVWIETSIYSTFHNTKDVTPRVGVWIETMGKGGLVYDY